MRLLHRVPTWWRNVQKSWWQHSCVIGCGKMHDGNSKWREMDWCAWLAWTVHIDYWIIIITVKPLKFWSAVVTSINIRPCTPFLNYIQEEWSNIKIKRHCSKPSETGRRYWRRYRKWVIEIKKGQRFKIPSWQRQTAIMTIIGHHMVTCFFLAWHNCFGIGMLCMSSNCQLINLAEIYLIGIINFFCLVSWLPIIAPWMGCYTVAYISRSCPRLTQIMYTLPLKQFFDWVCISLQGFMKIKENPKMKNT